MFFNKPKQKDNHSDEYNEYVDYKKIHTKSIIDGKLYDTEKAKEICCFKDGRVLFATEKGNYFSRRANYYNYTRIDNKNDVCYVVETSYFDIRPESVEDAMEAIGKYNPEKYIELFGEVEEA